MQSTLIPFLSGQYKVSVSISQSIDTSELYYAILHPSPTPTISYDGANLFSSKALSYQWFLSGSGKINGANDSIHAPNINRALLR